MLQQTPAPSAFHGGADPSSASPSSTAVAAAAAAAVAEGSDGAAPATTGARPVPTTTMAMPPYSTFLKALAVIDTAAQQVAAQETAMSAQPTFPATPFHSSAVPPMSLHAYAHYAAAHTGYKVEGLAVGLALMARYAVATGRGVTPLAMHRLFGTCLQVGMKASCDFFVKNVYVAPIAGMTLDELNDLELFLLDALEFRAMPTFAEVVDLPSALAAMCATPGRAALPPAAAAVTLGTVQSIFVHFAHLPPPPPHSATNVNATSGSVSAATTVTVPQPPPVVGSSPHYHQPQPMSRGGGDAVASSGAAAAYVDADQTGADMSDRGAGGGGASSGVWSIMMPTPVPTTAASSVQGGGGSCGGQGGPEWSASMNEASLAHERPSQAQE